MWVGEGEVLCLFTKEGVLVSRDLGLVAVKGICQRNDDGVNLMGAVVRRMDLTTRANYRRLRVVRMFGARLDLWSR